MPLAAGNRGDGSTTDTGQSGNLTLTELFFVQKAQDFIGKVSIEHN